MGPFGVIPFDPVSNSDAGFGEAGEVMLPDTLLFEATKEAFDEAVLFGGVGCDELLRQTPGFEKSAHCRFATPASNPGGAACRSAPSRPLRARVRLPWRDRARRI